MSAQLTVYEMAIAAERPLRMQEADHARRIALADAASVRRGDTLRHRLGAAFRQVQGSTVTVGRWTGTGARACPGGHLAG